MKRILTALTLSAALASPAWSENEDISFFDPDNWVGLYCKSSKWPTERLAVRKDLTAIFNYFDVIDECEQKHFNLICRSGDANLKYILNRMTGQLFAEYKNDKRFFECESQEEIF